MEEELKARMKEFTVGAIRLVEGPPRGQANDIIGKQLIRCASSVGANYRGACGARSKADFISKLSIAEEEADEAQYWLEILVALQSIKEVDFQRLHHEARELTAILTSSGKTAQANLHS